MGISYFVCKIRGNSDGSYDGDGERREEIRQRSGVHV